MRVHWTGVYTVTAMALLLIAGCGGGGDGGGNDNSTLIGPNGGTIRSGDGNANVQVPDAAIAVTQRFTCDRITNPQADPGLVTNTAYRFGPDGWAFDTPVTITIGYAEADIPAGMSQATLQIARLQPAGWVAVGASAVNQVTNTVSAEITGFSGFAILGLAPAQYVYDSQWGSLGNDDGEFMSMDGIAYRDGQVYVSDLIPLNLERIQLFDASGTFLSSCRDFDWVADSVSGIDVKADGTICATVEEAFAEVADDCGLVFRRDAADLGLAVFWPTDVALDGAGNVFIAEGNLHRITQLSSVGLLVRQFGQPGTGDGEFNQIGGVAVGPDGSVYASDRFGDRVLKFSNTGAFVDAWGETGDGNSQFDTPEGIDVDNDGDVYVADAVNNRVQKFDKNGAFITAFGEAGAGDGQFAYPNDVAVTPDGSAVYVVDGLNRRVQKFVEQ